MDVSQFYQTWLHLTVEPDAKPDFYQLLEISSSEENLDRIQTAAERRFSQLEQVDFVSHLPEYRTILRHITEAEMTLKTPVLRRRYDAERAHTGHVEASIYEYTKPGLVVRLQQWAFITVATLMGIGVAAYMGMTVERNPDGSVKFASSEVVVQKQEPFTRAPGKEFPRPNAQPKKLGVSHLASPKATETETSVSTNDADISVAGTNSTDLNLEEQGTRNAEEGALAVDSTLQATDVVLPSDENTPATLEAAPLDTELPAMDNTELAGQTPTSGNAEDFPAVENAENTDTTLALPELDTLADSGNSAEAETASSNDDEERELAQATVRTKPELRKDETAGRRVSPLHKAFQQAQESNPEVSQQAQESEPQVESEIGDDLNISPVSSEAAPAELASTLTDGDVQATEEDVQATEEKENLPLAKSGKAIPPQDSLWNTKLTGEVKDMLSAPQSMEMAQKQATELCKEADKTAADKDLAVYAKYRAALHLAGKAQNITLAFHVLEQMNANFEIDLVQEKAQTALQIAEALSQTAPTLKDKQPVIDLVQKTSDISNDLNQAQLYAEAKTLYDLVYQTAASSFLRRPQIQKMALQRKERADQVVRFHESYQKAKETLATNPEDAAANMKCALWVCQMDGGFEKALPFFAKCGQKELSQLASDELALTTAKADSARTLQLADSWWELAHQIPKPLNEQVYAHALSLYQRLDRNALANGEQARVAERIEKLQKTL